VKDLAEVHKPIMVREYPEGSLRGDALWPMFWSGREGSCPFVHPRQPPKHAGTNPLVPQPTNNTNNKTVLGENRQVVNRGRVFEQPASGIINSSNAFSAIRSTTTCGSKVTSTLSGPGGAIHHPTSLSREVRDMKTRTVIESVTKPVNMMKIGLTDPPPAKKRKVETTLRQQFARIKTKEKLEKKEGYCENCKNRFDDYQEVFTLFWVGLMSSIRNPRCIASMQRIIRILWIWMNC
jgi:hypothetical protein